MDHSLEAWQAAGHEHGSIVADPLFVDPALDDYRLRPDSPAIAIGFEPHDWTAAGVSGDPAGKARALETERPTMAVPVRPTPAGSRR